jgi:glyoxylase-like metal-dependent hydrolase (beta-lactamase superfamily II)
MAQAPIEFQRPIQSDIKGSKRLENWREPENPVRYAFAKLLRERDKTKRVYDVDPFAEVYTLRDGIYGIYTESLDGMGDSWIFLIEGPEKALLIDTSFGLGNLKGLVGELIGDKPYFVANTHSHFDHAYGNYQFDKVYCHEYEAPKLLSNMNDKVWDYLFDENGNGIWYDFKREDLCGFKEYEVVPVPDGYTFDLGGGHEVELVFLPGHTPGHCGFLDKKNRIFFPGDDCCVGAIGVGGQPGMPYGEYCTVEALYNEFKKITARVAEFDSLFPSHGPVETGPVMLFSAMEACKAVLDDPSAYDRKMETRRGVQYGKMIFESGYLQYNSKSVYMDRDAKIE